jgi:hypothetical protein
LQGQTVYGGCSEPASSLFVSVKKLMVYRTCGTIEIVNCDSFLDIVNSARKDSILATLTH